jgi:O-antigen/teichoic acid export membrane protein
MGYYSKALGTEKLASTSISQIMTQVTYPLYAEAQDDLVTMRNMIKRLTTTIAYITFPLMFILLLCAKPIFVLLYSERWLASIPFFQVLCIAGLATCLQSVNLQTISAIGKSRVMFSWSVAKQIVIIVLIVSGLYLFGMKGLLAGYVIGSWFVLFVNIGLVSKYIGYRWWRQLLDILPVLVASVIAALISYGCSYLLGLKMYPDGIVRFLVFLVVYLGWSFIFKPEAFTYTLSILPMKRFKRKEKEK